MNYEDLDNAELTRRLNIAQLRELERPHYSKPTIILACVGLAVTIYGTWSTRESNQELSESENVIKELRKELNDENKLYETTSRDYAEDLKRLRTLEKTITFPAKILGKTNAQVGAISINSTLQSDGSLKGKVIATVPAQAKDQEVSFNYELIATTGDNVEILYADVISAKSRISYKREYTFGIIKGHKRKRYHSGSKTVDMNTNISPEIIEKLKPETTFSIRLTP